NGDGGQQDGAGEVHQPAEDRGSDGDAEKPDAAVDGRNHAPFGLADRSRDEAVQTRQNGAGADGARRDEGDEPKTAVHKNGAAQTGGQCQESADDEPFHQTAFFLNNDARHVGGDDHAQQRDGQDASFEDAGDAVCGFQPVGQVKQDDEQDKQTRGAGEKSAEQPAAFP